ncbi:MAG TPA: asparagine synthase-related protein, partial [Woeseiaceae bacterium]|nr:asparagine synthase-related protein [Woeseiaceae bacterium]
HCTASRTLRQNGLIIGLSGAGIWRGRAIPEVNADVVLSELAATYREKGPGVLDELEGAFALIVLEPNRRKALLAIDRMGVEALAYAVHDGDLTFADSANAVAEARGVPPVVRPQAFFDFLFLHVVPAPWSVYEETRKLPLASVLEFQDGRADVRRYWQPCYRYASRRDFADLKASLHHALETAVRASDPGDATGAFLSGGLDSSSVAGVLRVVRGVPVPTFTVGFGGSEHDELKFARAANRHFRNRAFEYQMRPADIVDAFPRIAAAYDEPFGNSSAAPTYLCAKLAADNGITHMLGGDGGDELFGGNERYVRHWILELYYRFPEWLRRGFLEPATRPISPESRIMPLRKIRNYIDQALIPLPDRFESWNYMYREGGDDMLHPEFATSIDPEGPLVRLRELWNAAPSENLLERMLWYDWQLTLADNDLRKVTTMAALAGVRVSFPMLHPAVVELSTRVPPDMKIEGQELRSFFKRAMAEFLPREIIEKKKHGFALPFGAWMKTDKALGDLFYSHLSDLKKRRIVAASFIDNLIEQHRTGHPSYYGYAIWDLAMLEAWMAQHLGPA